MEINIVHAGRRGSARELSLALYEILKSGGFDCRLFFSRDVEWNTKIITVYPEAEFIDFTSFSSFLSLQKDFSNALCFFPMTSPKLLPLYLFSNGKKVLYFHSNYDYSLSPPSLKDIFIEKLTEFYINRSKAVFTTQYPLAWQLKFRLGIEARVLPHPTYYFIRESFFKDRTEVPLSFNEYFLLFGDLDRAAKGVDVFLEAVKDTHIRAVIAGRRRVPERFRTNIIHINKWLSDQEIFWLVDNATAIVLPYLSSSQFSGCLALAYRFGKPVIVPFSNSFQKYVLENKTGLFFEQGNPKDLQEKLMLCDSVGFKKKDILHYDKQLNILLAKQILSIFNEILQ